MVITMADYIKCKNCDSTDCNGCNIKTLETMLYEGRFDCLMNGNRSINQSADVAPMRYGRWISLTDCSNAGVYCSVCHKKVYKEDYAICNRKNKLRSDYCPKCGAKMDGGTE